MSKPVPVKNLRTQRDYESVIKKDPQSEWEQRGRHAGAKCNGSFVPIPSGHGPRGEIPIGTKKSIDNSCQRLGIWDRLCKIGVVILLYLIAMGVAAAFALQGV